MQPVKLMKIRNSFLFTGQLRELYNVSLARVLCDNIPSMTNIQPSVLHMVQWNQIMNSRRPCSSLPTLNLDNWFTK